MGITHSFETVQRSSTAEDRLRLMIDTILVQVARARPDGSLDFINHRWLEYLGVSVEVVQDWGWTTVTHPEDIERSCAVGVRPWHRVNLSRMKHGFGGLTANIGGC